MSRWISQLGYAWRRHGPVGFLKLAMDNVVYHLRRRVARLGMPPQLDPFDEKYGTDTGGIREIRSLDAASLPNATYAVRYGPSGEQGVRASLEKLNIDPGDFTFIDFGSGKGRVLLIAAGLPFRAVVGIEFSRELHETAVQNIQGFPPHLISAGTVTSRCQDAASFPLPPSNLVCYFHNPFGPPVLSNVVARLEAHRDTGYRIFVIYLDPRHREVFEETGKFAIFDEITKHPRSDYGTNRCVLAARTRSGLNWISGPNLARRPLRARRLQFLQRAGRHAARRLGNSDALIETRLHVLAQQLGLHLQYSR